MIKLTMNVSPREYAELLRARRLLSRANRAGISDKEIEDYRKTYDRVQSGVMLSAMMAADEYHQLHHAHLPEVVNG